jgi:RNA polymerase sigma factor for flagellar operon FliA
METTAAGGTRLTPSEAEALWRAWSTGNDTNARDKLILSYVPMVSYLASRKVRELPAHCELDDLVSCGLLSLIEAVDRFKPALGATFEQYAWTRVSGAIIDELRRQDWASRSVRRMGRKIERARDELYARNGLMPTDQEVADVLDTDVAAIRNGTAEIERADVMSLNAPAHGTDDILPVEVGDTVEAISVETDPELALLASERFGRVREAVQSLDEREREVLALVHAYELPGAEIAGRFGVTESRVSQVLGSARRKLQAQLEAYDGPNRDAA